MEVEGWSDQKPYGELLDEMAQAGYAGTELGPYGYFPTESERLRRELAARQLELVAAFVPVPLITAAEHEAAVEEAVKTARLLAAVGARLILLSDAMSEARIAVAGRVNSAAHGMSDRQWEGAVEIINRIAAACRELGLKTAFHHHTGSFIETPDEIARLCASTDPNLLGLCLDTGHYFYGGGDPVEAVRKYGQRIWHLHLKDVQPAVLDRMKSDGVGFLDAVRRGVFCELGQGAVDFPKIIEGLTASGYSGWAIVEQDTDARQEGVDPAGSAARSRQYLRDTIGV
jgi:inosose dehydratase